MVTPDWFLDETAHAGDEHLDQAYVEHYDAKAGYDPSEDIDALIRAGLDDRSVVVDLGAGTGAFAMAVAPLCRRVIAVDVSPAMTAALGAAAAHIDNLEVVEAGFLSYRHQGAPVDAIFTRNALHHLPDFWKGIALHRMASILRPGGILLLRDLVFDFQPDQAAEKIDAWIAGAVSDPAKGFTAEELATHVRTEFSTYTWLLEPLLDRVGFTVLERSVHRSAYATYICQR